MCSSADGVAGVTGSPGRIQNSGNQGSGVEGLEVTVKEKRLLWDSK